MKLQGVRRRAKFLIFDFANQYSLVFHLGLEGLFLLDGGSTENVHLVFHFADDKRIYFDDIKGYGRLFLVPTDRVEELPGIAKLGLEPFTPGYS